MPHQKQKWEKKRNRKKNRQERKRQRKRNQPVQRRRPLQARLQSHGFSSTPPQPAHGISRAARFQARPTANASTAPPPARTCGSTGATPPPTPPSTNVNGAGGSIPL